MLPVYNTGPNAKMDADAKTDAVLAPVANAEAWPKWRFITLVPTALC
jgi:hypothetical protein